jgi:hypothetical protein
MSDQEKIITEDDVLDYIFQALYINLDKNELHFENEIINPSQLSIDEKQIEHLRELTLSTGFVNASVGFGKNGYIYLNKHGIQLIKIYKSYSNYVATIPTTQTPHTPQLNNSTEHNEQVPDQPKYMNDEMSG